jgi:heme oxygenase
MTEGALRERLRRQTASVHARLHRHPGLSAAASGLIEMDSYRALLMRLYGFHRAFEARVANFVRLGDAPARSELLASDLEALGLAPEELASIALCGALAPIGSDAEALGALYVMEGSALGGARIARALSATLLAKDTGGCRFFSSGGVPRRAWENLLDLLKAIDDPHQEQAALAAALATFHAFEVWMKDWDSAETMAGVR